MSNDFNGVWQDQFGADTIIITDDNMIFVGGSIYQLQWIEIAGNKFCIIGKFSYGVFISYKGYCRFSDNKLYIDFVANHGISSSFYELTLKSKDTKSFYSNWKSKDTKNFYSNRPEMGFFGVWRNFLGNLGDLSITRDKIRLNDEEYCLFYSSDCIGIFSEKESRSYSGKINYHGNNISFEFRAGPLTKLNGYHFYKVYSVNFGPTLSRQAINELNSIEQDETVEKTKNLTISLNIPAVAKAFVIGLMISVIAANSATDFVAWICTNVFAALANGVSVRKVTDV